MFRKSFAFRKKNSDDGRRRTSASSDKSIAPEDDGSTFPFPSRATTANESHVSLRDSQTNIQHEPESEADAGALGLSVVYTPPNGHKADIVFVHGLGGTSRWTWSKHRNPDLFWPLTFLPLEPDLCLARMLTFGYNANFRKAGNVNTSVLDFAKDLLFDLKFARDANGDELEMGRVPLIFVVHSMGGLIAKEAYMQGQNDPDYESIIKAVSAITFLATPHRGTNLADTLNRILQSTFISSKQYISELTKSSFTLQKLNEQFRHIAPKLDIISFYETQPTSIGLKKARVMVLEKESSVLGYPGETSKALNADHHGVCKYDSPGDPNYIIVRNVLKSLVGKIISRKTETNKIATPTPERPLVPDRRQSHDLKSVLAISELPSIDYSFFWDQWVEGTGDWILQDDNYLEWLHEDPSPRLLWLTGGPAAGKSVLSSFLINRLVQDEGRCQYFFIRYGDKKKRTLSLLLRSIAYQMALNVPGFAQKVVDLAEEAIEFGTADSRTIWDCIFKSSLSKMEIDRPLYWIIDGLDEADDPRAIFKLLSDLSSSSLPIRILVVSRKTNEIQAAFQKVPAALRPSTISIDGHLDDLRCYIRRELNIDAGNKDDLVKRIVDGAQNNFLWVRLAVEKLNQCHRQTDVERALQQLPVGMEALYDRMALSIAQDLSPSDRDLASTILQRVTCSLRVLTIAELSQALDEEVDVSEVLNLQRTIVDVCCGFVVVDNSGNVAMIHQTAREYLLDGDESRPFYVDRRNAHKQMFLSCIRCLMTTGLRAKISRNQMPEFLDYAATAWSSHLVVAPVESIETAEALRKFLRSHSVLTWVHILASSGRLGGLVQTSKHLSRYSAERRARDDVQSENEHHTVVSSGIMDSELFDCWAIDFVKLAGKFGRNLRRSPESIYKVIPPFCPQNSAVYQQFGKSEARNLSVSGLSTDNWDDSLGRFSFGFGTYASFIHAGGAQIFVLVSSGSVFIYDSSTFEETASSPIKHGERVYRMQINSPGTVLVTYGYRTTKVWDVSSGACKMSISNVEIGLRPLALLFKNNGTSLLVGTDDRRVRSVDLNSPSPVWNLVAELEEPELEGHFLNAASHMALNRDGSLITVAYRGHPLSAWETDGPIHIGHCWRKDADYRGEVVEAVWHPHFPTVYGLYTTGQIFRWQPYDGEIDELSVGANRLTISRDGSLLATGDVHGTVKIYTTSGLSIMYQLASQDTVLALAFSPDLRRFYDIRGYYGNAWEPNALLRFAERSGKSIDRESDSETESLAPSSTLSVNTSKWIDAVTVLATSPVGRLYCYGTEKGTVVLHDTHLGRIGDIYSSKNPFSIDRMAWSPNGRLLCFSDSSRKVFIMSITPGPGNSGPDVGTPVIIPMQSGTKGSILQLLFQPDSSHILVHTASMVHTISVATSSTTKSTKLQATECKWMVHPRDPSLIIGFGATTLHVLDWSLAERQTFDLEYSLAQAESSNAASAAEVAILDRVLLTYDKKAVLVQMSFQDHRSRDKIFLYINTDSFSMQTTATPEEDSPVLPVSIKPTVLPRNTCSQIALALAFLPNNRLIFLSKKFQICSWQVTTGSGRTAAPFPVPRAGGAANFVTQQSKQNKNTLDTELFSLPGDWISRECLVLCSVWGREKSLLCPRNGEVAVVRSTALV